MDIGTIGKCNFCGALDMGMGTIHRDECRTPIRKSLIDRLFESNRSQIQAVKNTRENWKLNDIKH